jgi:GNAT superfamily N-acetyltransferase
MGVRRYLFGALQYACRSLRRLRTHLLRPLIARRYRWTVVMEAELSPSLRRNLGHLLADAFPAHKATYREQAWRTLPPVFRVVTWCHSLPVGQISAFHIPTNPPRRLFGIGDLVVDPQHRSRGLAKRQTVLVRQRCWELGADGILSDTYDLRSVSLSLGSKPVRRFEIFYETAIACHWHPNWLAKWRNPPDGRLRLSWGDF